MLSLFPSPSLCANRYRVTYLSCDTKTIAHFQFSKAYPSILGIELFVFDKQILNLLCRVIATDFQDKIGKEMIVLYNYLPEWKVYKYSELLNKIHLLLNNLIKSSIK